MIDKCEELSNALVQVGEMDEEPQERDKFSKLKQYLEDCGKSELTLTFAEIEEIIGCSLCKSAYTGKHWGELCEGMQMHYRYYREVLNDDTLMEHF